MVYCNGTYNGYNGIASRHKDPHFPMIQTYCNLVEAEWRVTFSKANVVLKVIGLCRYRPYLLETKPAMFNTMFSLFLYYS